MKEIPVNEKPYLLVVEDDPGIAVQLKWCFERYEVVHANTQKEAIALLRRFEPSVITLDLGLPPDPNGVSEGFEVLDEILKLSPHTKVIVCTGSSDRQHAMEAVARGAYDFYVKPLDKDILNLIVERAFYLHGLESDYLNIAKCNVKEVIPDLITCSPNMVKICRIIEKISVTDISTLLLGESGTGKEVIAKGIHFLSSRKNQPFIAINCAAIPENLLESELFGYEKGAFTGAQKQTLGKIEASHTGTLFLDEIGDLPLALQPKLLRFLQERTIERLGGRQTIPLDVRVVCATHQNLEVMIEKQLFREDLFYRISEMKIEIPPLREREGDSVLLAHSFLSVFSKMYQSKIKGFTQVAKEAICHYSWPGNVRELENRIKRAVVMAENSLIGLEDLDFPPDEKSNHPFNLKQIRDEAERRTIVHAIHFVNGNMTKASELLGVTRPTLYHLVEKLDIRDQVHAEGSV